MKNIWLTALVIGLLFTSCKKENNPIENGEDNIDKVNFADLNVCDESRYAGFKVKVNSADDYDFEYTGDTLIFRVLDKQGNKYLMQEKMVGAEVIIPEMQNIQYYMEIEGNAIKLEDVLNLSYSELFLTGDERNKFYELFTLEELEAPIFAIDFEDVYTGPFADTSGVVLNSEILNKNYTQLNYTQIVSPLGYDGFAHYWLYSKQQGIVRKYNYNPWTQEYQGWDLILE